MGFSSYNCEKCGLSIRAPEVEGQGHELNQAVALLENGSLIKGDYNGYQSFVGMEMSLYEHAPTMYHRKCWEEAGSPTEYQGESQHAEDQGFFVASTECEECGCELVEGETDICDECEYAEDDDWCYGCDLPPEDCECDL